VAKAIVFILASIRQLKQTAKDILAKHPDFSIQNT
jgi:hypothetical protein